MEPSASSRTYARARLWLGITCVGTNVLLASALLVGQVPQRLFADVGPGLAAEASALGLFLAAYVLFMLPFDLLGGYLLPRQFGRDQRSLSAYLAPWLRGVLVHSGAMLVSGLVILAAGRQFGLLGAGAAVLGMMLAMLAFQVPLARLTARLPLRRMEARDDRQVVLESADDGFVGGLSGLPGLERLVVPMHWSQQLPESELRAQLARREGALTTGTRRRGVSLALLWNLGGFVLCALLPGSGVVSVAGLVTLVLWFTLWAFIGLLILPSPSRAGVLEVDREAIDRGVPLADLQAVMSRLDRLQEDEPQRSAGVEAIFHPVPSVATRLATIEQGTRRRGAWQAARMALPLSWPCLGLLSRAVHCNSGRPSLWVMLPGD